MATKKKLASKSIKRAPKISPKAETFMGLTRSQTQSLSVGIVIVGLGLFIIAGLAYKSNKQATQSILSEGAKTYQTAITPTNIVVEKSAAPTAAPSATSGAQEAMTVTPTENPTQMPTVTPTISPTEMAKATTAPLATPTPKTVGMVKKLPNTSSKVTYTVMDGDNIAKIGKQLCDSDRAYLSIVATNNIPYPYIVHPGETYIITCH